jgi:hypothetical protein
MPPGKETNIQTSTETDYDKHQTSILPVGNPFPHSPIAFCRFNKRLPDKGTRNHI